MSTKSDTSVNFTYYEGEDNSPFVSTKYQCSSPQHATSPKVTPPQLDGRPTETDDATGPLPPQPVHIQRNATRHRTVSLHQSGACLTHRQLIGCIFVFNRRSVVRSLFQRYSIQEATLYSAIQISLLQLPSSHHHYHHHYAATPISTLVHRPLHWQ